MGTTDRLAQLIRQAVEEEGYELVYSELARSGRQSVLKVYIDKPNGITLEDCRQVSEKVSVMLDVEDLISARYTLEVSSPGLDRPLLKDQDYVRFQGRRAKLRTRTAINGQRNFKGLLEHCRNGAVTLLEDDKKSPVEISLDNIERANLLFELKN